MNRVFFMRSCLGRGLGIMGGFSVAVATVIAGGPARSVGDHFHAAHNSPGNPIANSVSENVTLVDSDGGASGGHVVSYRASGSTSARTDSE